MPSKKQRRAARNARRRENGQTDTGTRDGRSAVWETLSRCPPILSSCATSQGRERMRDKRARGSGLRDSRLIRERQKPAQPDIPNWSSRSSWASRLPKTTYAPLVGTRHALARLKRTFPNLTARMDSNTSRIRD